MREEAETEVPTLLAHARDDASAARRKREARLEAAAELGRSRPTPEAAIPEAGSRSAVRRARRRRRERLLASWLWETSGEPYEALLARVRGLGRDDQERLFEQALAARGPRDAIPEGMEGAGQLSFEVIVDFGAYRDIGRHRKGFQDQQRLTTALGFCVPPLFDEAGLGDRYREVMRSVGARARRIAARFPDAAGYVVPFGYRQRIRIDFDLRQMAYFCELRSAPEGHFSYREVAIRMADELVRVAPLYERFVRTCRERVLLGRVEAERGRDERRRTREERARRAGFET
ncbi:MAG: FAD-dependent thymidylate synthase [Planctomycetota bacterium]